MASLNILSIVISLINIKIKYLGLFFWSPPETKNSDINNSS